ncbi:MAG: isoleucine--tRNA ligase [bacterium]
MTFRPVDPKVNFPKQEEEILSFWDKEKIFQQSLILRKDAKRYVFFEGPPTANAKPGLHHVLARYFKDLFPRYKTMRGFLVERKAGWDTHGLPIEIAVEKELGIMAKPEIEKYGVEKFNAKARENVWVQKEAWEKFTRRSGFWLDLEHPYITYDATYIESVWAILKTAWDKSLVYQSYRVSPRCTRCGTALSSHEVAQGYREVEENSVFIKFKVKDKPDTYILSWTTTPWTLPGNVALAVGPEIKYRKVHVKSGKHTVETYIVAQDRQNEVIEPALGHILTGDSDIAPSEVSEPVIGKDLVGLEYEPLFPDAVPSDTPNFKNAFKVYPADFVTTQEGTGVVHIAVMYGEDDYQLGEKVGLPKFHTVAEDGKFGASVKLWAGRYVKDKEVEEEIVADLKKRGLLLKERPYTHDYPFCWRCETPLLYYAANSWFIEMSKLRDEMIASNRKINWVPDYFKDGRFGEWLREVKDWSISRERYWGTPLPFWVSEDGEKLCIGSFEELARLAGKQVGGLAGKTGKTDFDPHKPFVDEIVIVKDGKEYRRVPEVLDAWFDSGAMPFAQWHYPFENRERVDVGLSYPADFISEAVDQTRGWFYTLLAVATLMDKPAPYKNVICLGHILDKHGKKMSKSKGNVVDSWAIFDAYGSDALRWYLYTINQPGLPKNFDEEGVKQVVRRFMLTLWNTYSFFVTYANIDGFKPILSVKVEPQNVLDRWIWMRARMTILQVERKLDEYDAFQAALVMEKFVDDLSNWYVRRSRRRFWKGEYDTDKQQAYIVLYSVLKDFVKILAPFMPFLSDVIYTNLRAEGEPVSVHLTDWPVVEDKFDKHLEALIADMETARSMITVGLELRETAGVRVRQPLQYFSTGRKKLPDELVEIIKDELNVKEVKFGAAGPDSLALKKEEITPELILEGQAREIVRTVQVLRKESGLEITDRIKLTWSSDVEEIKQAFVRFGDYIKAEVLADELTEGDGQKFEINGHVVKLKVASVK